ncbi:hypothetical protein [Roseateles depolymerans]|uniref:Uncharacterized protein n=1 Tax=Roseateles depolymerans TaxID=76731 RepID=A0A0U3MS29_9BURK|nr:hypothetical protein [Roseateles depolymerans]ALV04676.1 hypothetical protein RD2015_171 [Roseateles depolymerans]REG15315.1 hypothetical protein DES44_3823 [Roseateles depolymerans]
MSPAFKPLLLPRITAVIHRPTHLLLCAALAAACTWMTPQTALAHGDGGSEASAALSGLPIAVSVVAPSMVLTAGASLVVVAVEVTASGTVWVLKRVSDGVKVSVRFAGKVVTGASVAVGTAVTVVVVGTGLLLSAAGEAIAFIPNEIGASLMHNERITPRGRNGQ